MKKIKLYIAASIDGYIARTNGDLDWLTEFPNPNKDDSGYTSFYESVGTVIMGGRTYHSILSMDVLWPYQDKESYIITRQASNTEPKHIHFVTDDIINFISKKKQEEGKDIWLVGGGELLSLLLSHNLIDSMIITYIPVLLGSGIPLFPDNSKESVWDVYSCVAFENGVIQVEYISK